MKRVYMKKNSGSGILLILKIDMLIAVYINYTLGLTLLSPGLILSKLCISPLRYQTLHILTPLYSPRPCTLSIIKLVLQWQLKSPAKIKFLVKYYPIYNLKETT